MNTSFIIVPFDVAHLQRLEIQDAQCIPKDQFQEALAAPFGQAWTGMVDDVPMACAGLVNVWEGRAYAWALLGKHSGPWMTKITKAIKRGLNSAPFNRIEMAVDSGFEAGQRWAVILGFKLETPEPMRAYLPSGQSAYLYSMVR